MRRDVWLVIDYGGSWEDSWEEPVAAFGSMKRAAECAAKRRQRQAHRCERGDPFEYVGSNVVRVPLVMEERGIS